MFDAALGASSVSWCLVQAEVERTTRTCAYDRAGFGWSDAGPLPRSAGPIADDLWALLERSGTAPPYLLVGHSYGGLVMRIFAARHRPAVAGLVLVDPAHPQEWLEPDDAQRRQIERGVRLCRYGGTAARLGIARSIAALVGIGALAPARALAGLVSRGGLSRDDEQILAPVWKLPPEARRPLRQFWIMPKFYEALGSQIDTISTSAIETRDAGIDALRSLPLVVISASTSSQRRVELNAALARQSSRGRHVVASRSGHWIPLDEPAVVAREILDLVEGDRRGGSSRGRGGGGS